MASFSTRRPQPFGYVMHPYTPPIRGQFIGGTVNGLGDVGDACKPISGWGYAGLALAVALAFGMGYAYGEGN